VNILTKGIKDMTTTVADIDIAYLEQLAASAPIIAKTLHDIDLGDVVVESRECEGKLWFRFHCGSESSLVGIDPARFLDLLIPDNPLWEAIVNDLTPRAIKDKAGRHGL
jgi:hypothetical protein